MKRYRVNLIIVALLLVAGIASSSYAVSESAVLFLRIAPGSRAAGMGEAFVAIADDATATHWNPAGLGAYPLAHTWITSSIPSKYCPLRGIAALKKGKGSNYLDYDVWAITPQGLVRYDNKGWYAKEIFGTRTDETVEQRVRKYYSVSDETRLAEIIEKVAVANSGGTYEELVELRDRIAEAVPDDYSDRDALVSGLDSLLVSYHLCLIKWDQIAKVRKVFGDGFKDSVLTETEIDRVDIAVEKSLGRFIPEELALPYSASLSGELTAITSNGDVLLVGTTEGLVRYDGLRWQRYKAEPGGLPSNNITCLSNLGHSTLIGTDSGVAVFDGMTLARLDTAASLPAGSVEAISGSSTNDIYAVVNHDLYHYNGQTWTNTMPYTVVLDDSPEAIAEKFALYGSAVEKKKYIDKFNQIDQSPEEGDTLADAETLLSPGAVVRVPCLVEIKGKVRCIYGSLSDKLWLGTDHGVLVFSGGEWQLPGYRRHTVQEGQTLDSLVAFRHVIGSEKAAAYAELIRKLNDLGEDQMEAGSEVLVADNPVAAPVSKITSRRGQMLFATDEGLLEFDDNGWSRSGIAGLGNSRIPDVISTGQEIWIASADRIVTAGKGRSEITLMHVNWLPELADDLYYEFFSYVRSLESWGTIGGNITFLSYGSIQFTDDKGNPGDVFDAFEIAFTISYGTALTSKLAGGISAKVIHSRLSNVGASKLEKGDGIATGFGIDLGLLYKLNKKLTLGVVITNIGPKFSYIDAAQSDDLPRNLAIGFAYELLRSEYNRFLVTAEANKILVRLDDGFTEEMKQFIFNGGAEFTYANMFSARAGYIYDQEGKIKTITLGAGLALFDRFKFDFAYIPSNEDVSLANTVRVSISVLP